MNETLVSFETWHHLTVETFRPSELQTLDFNSGNDILHCFLRRLIGWWAFTFQSLLSWVQNVLFKTHLFYTLDTTDAYKLTLSILINKLWAGLGQNTNVASSHFSNILLILSSSPYTLGCPFKVLLYLAWENAGDEIYCIGFEKSIYLMAGK